MKDVHLQFQLLERLTPSFAVQHSVRDGDEAFARAQRLIKTLNGTKLDLCKYFEKHELSNARS